jgi:minichromosome maintenance protein 10
VDEHTTPAHPATMIVRESPKSRGECPGYHRKGRMNANRSIAQKNAQNWPPKSPHEALLASPSGRRKYEQRRERNSVSPSPIKRRPMSRGNPGQVDDGDTEEDDEETLQLQLQAIEARLKLKKLQKARRTDNESSEIPSRPGTAANFRRPELPRPQSEIQVPVSPMRSRRAQDEPKSPARVLLGIDKGMRAQDVSLKRPTSYAARMKAGVVTGRLSRAETTRETETPRKSFSERIAESREKDKERDQRQARIEQSRSRGFGLQAIEGLKDRPASRAASALSTDSRTSQSTASHPSRTQSRSVDLRAAPTTRPASALPHRTAETSRSFPAPSKPTFTFGVSKTAAKYAEIADRDESTDAPSFESFSGLHLKSREMQHNVIARTLEGKTVLTIPQLLKVVKAPDYDPPDMENDYVVLGVIASKSSPMTPKNAVRDRSVGNQDTDTLQSNKFMVIKLVDLKWELDLFLFDTGFSQFWKLTVGTLIAVLNPDIMPPRNRDTGKFSLKLTSSDDTVLEIGMARDLDFCHSMKKDGKECGTWIDGRKTQFCDFHIELQVDKNKRGRMEINTMTGFGKGPGGTGKGGMFGGGRGGPKGDELKREGKFHDRTLHETMYIAPGVGGTARLLDRDEQGWDQTHRAERHRKQLADKEKERDLAKRLGDMGSGAGSDYMKHKGAGFEHVARGPAPVEGPAKDTASNDFTALLHRKAEDVSLGPTKRKRINSTRSINTSAPVGWGGAYKRGLLLSPTKPSSSFSSNGTRSPSPVKKKARYLVPEKGIREPGRDSLGTMDIGLIAAMDDEDDDLEVV